MTKSKALTVVLNSISNFSGYAVTIVLGLISYPIIIRLIGIEAVGVYALMMAILAPMDLTNLGFAEAAIKFVAQFTESKDYDKVKQYVSTTFLMSIVVGILGMIIIFFVGPPVAYSLFDFKSQGYDTIRLCFGMVAIGWLVRQLTAVFMSVPTAFQKFKIVALGNSLTSIITTSSILITLTFLQNVVGYSLGTLIGAILSMILWYVISIINFSHIKYTAKFYKEVWRSSISYGGWQTIGSIGGLVANQADKYLLGIYLPASASGIYNVIIQIQQRILSAVWKIAEVMFPHFSASSQQDLESKFRTLIRSNYILSALGVIIFFPFIILAKPILGIWINAEFASAGYSVMQCLLLVGVFASITVVQSFFLMGNAKVKQVTLITYFTGGVTAIGSLLLIPNFGLPGAGYGVLFAAMSRLLLFYFLVKRFFGNYFYSREYIVANLLPVFSGLIVLGIFTYLPVQPIGILPLLFWYCFITGLILALLILLNFVIPKASSHNKEIVALILEMKMMYFRK